MKAKYYCYVLMALTLNAVAQNANSVSNQGSRENFLYTYVSDASNTDATGSPYINEAYMPAKVTGFDGLAPPIRYNAEKDEMEFLKDGKKYYIIKQDSVEINFYSKKYKYLNYQDKKEEKYGYLVVLVYDVKQTYSLYKKEKITLVPRVEAKSGYDEARPANYRKEEDKFYIAFSNKIIAMPNKKKELLALVPNQVEAIESYLKANKVSFDNESHLIELVKFMNTLK